MDIQSRYAMNNKILEGVNENLPLSELYRMCKLCAISEKDWDEDLFFDLYFLQSQIKALKKQMEPMVKIIAMKLESTETFINQ